MKKHFTSFLAVALCAAAFLLAPASAQVPQLVSYQGRVAVGTTNFNGAGSFKFALVNTAGTTTFWSNDGTSVAGSQPTAAVALTVTKGLYSVLLGDTTLPNMTAIPATVWANADVRLRVWFNDGTNGFQLLTPDQRLAPNGYVPDGAISTAALAANAVTTAKIASGAVGNAQIASGLDAGKITTGTFPALNGGALTNLTAANLNGTLPALAGGNLTGLNASNISAGTLADARLSANIPLLNAGGNTFTGTLGVSGATTLGGNLIISGPTARMGLNTLGYANVAFTLKGRAGDSSMLDLQSSTGTDVFFVNDAGNTTIGGTLAVSGGTTLGGNLIVSGPTARMGLNTAGYSNVAFTLKGRAGDNSILDLQSSTGTDVFFVNDAGTTTIAGGTTINNNAHITGTTVLDGLATLSGMTQQGTGTGTSEAPDKPLITRRVKSINSAAGQIVARTDVLTLERDGTPGGFLVRYTNADTVVVAAQGVTLSGAAVSTYQRVPSPSASGTVPVFSNAQNVHYMRVQFGNPFNTVHQTTVEISRYDSDLYWTGVLTSTVNQ